MSNNFDPMNTSNRSSGAPNNDMMSSSRASSSSGGNDVSLSSSRPSSGSGARNESEWQKIRHKQQRLLLLRHASRCQHPAGKCPITPHCASMKRLWEHIAHCKNQQCQVQHCLSSRYVLSHYRRCKDARCPACGPVRETIRKSHEREQSTGVKNQSAAGNAFDQMGQDPSTLSNGPSSSSPPISEPQAKKSKTQHPGHMPGSMMSDPSQVGSDGRPMVPGSTSSGAMAPGSSAQKGAQADSVGSKQKSSKPVDSSLLESFTVQQLQTHLASLERKSQLPPAKLKAKCSELLKGLQTHQHGWVFNAPVDPVELGLPDYFEIIKRPMDLGTIQKKLESGGYHSIEDFTSDTNLTFDNAMTYNEDGSVVYEMAKELKTKFESDLKKLMKALEIEDREKRDNERACMLCGAEKRLFEPPVYFCNGMNCQSQRIRRNSHFYIGGNNQYFWCTPCYNELDDKIPIELVDMTITKGDLKKKKNDEVHEESWVQCDLCQRWVHQICGLFNTRQNTGEHTQYCCPRCLCDKRKKSGAIGSQKPPGARDLPRTTLSEWLEQQICKKVVKRKRELAEMKASTEVCVFNFECVDIARI